MKTLLISLVLVGATAFAAHAETFTGSATSTITSSNVFAASAGKPVVENNINFAGQTIWASGKTTANKGTCANWTTPPGSIFDANGVCNYTDANGDAASILIGCDFAGKDMSQGNCWGGLLGTAGPHAGKSGTISWHFRAAADGKSGESKSVGQWND